MPHFKCKNNKIYNSLHSFSSTAAKIWNSLPNALGTTCDINVLKILNYPTVSPPFSSLPFKIPTKGGGPGDISLVSYKIMENALIAAVRLPGLGLSPDVRGSVDLQQGFILWTYMPLLNL